MNNSGEPKVCAVVVAYNGMRWYDWCFASLKSSTYPVRIVVVNNASSDGTVSYIQENYPEIVVLDSDVNLGYTRAVNKGLKYAIDNNYDYVLLLDQDACVSGNAVEEMIGSYLNNPEAGIVSSIHLNGKGDKLDHSFPSNMPGEFVSDLYFGSLAHEYSVKAINSACWMLKVENVVRYGGMDTILFEQYGGDSNYCNRMLYHKKTIIINTSCSMCHDREWRKLSEAEYRASVFKYEDMEKKSYYSNPMNDISIEALIASNKRSAAKCFLKLRISKAIKHREEIAFLEKARLVRDNGIKGGLSWLSE